MENGLEGALSNSLQLFIIYDHFSKKKGGVVISRSKLVKKQIQL